MLALKKIGATRLIKNEFFDRVKAAEDRGASADEMREILGRGRAKLGIFEGDLVEGELEIGQIASLLKELPSAKDALMQIVDEYNQKVKSSFEIF